MAALTREGSHRSTDLGDKKEKSILLSPSKKAESCKSCCQQKESISTSAQNIEKSWPSIYVLSESISYQDDRSQSPLLVPNEDLFSRPPSQQEPKSLADFLQTVRIEPINAITKDISIFKELVSVWVGGILHDLNKDDKRLINLYHPA